MRNSFESIHELRALSISSQAAERLQALSEMPDESDEFDDMPEVTPEQFARSVRGFLPVSEQQMTLWLDDEVQAWLTEQNIKSHRLINHVLRREMQYQQRQAAKG